MKRLNLAKLIISAALLVFVGVSATQLAHTQKTTYSETSSTVQKVKFTPNNIDPPGA